MQADVIRRIEKLECAASRSGNCTCGGHRLIIVAPDDPPPAECAVHPGARLIITE